MGTIYEKNSGKKSRATVPLKRRPDRENCGKEDTSGPTEKIAIIH